MKSPSLLILLLLLLILSTTAFAGASRDRTQFGHDITVRAGEETDELTCFGCSIKIRGQVNGDVTTFGGSILVEEGGKVGGDATAFAGTLRLDAGTSLGGDAAVFGGRLQHDPSATIGGDVTAFRGGIWIALIFGFPFLLLGAFIALIVWLVRKLTHRTVPVTA
ncbi:MAG TPA: hypothetical protein VHW45_05200 [Candidatus Sulfotelmatobacter sp.]|jgi:hypothetical protein|nr:hypothetical protein [Candidatus Sulfotelmatobacter sp.]